MIMSTLYSLGVDVAGKKLDACLMLKKAEEGAKIKATRKFDNTTAGIEALWQWVCAKGAQADELSVVMEATGVYYESLAFAMHAHGARVSVLLPNRVKAYMRFLNLKSKTDRLEAKALARLGMEQELDAWQPASPQMYMLKGLSRERVRLLEEKTLVSNQLHAEQARRMPGRQTLRRLEQRIRFIEKQLKGVEKDLRQTVARDTDLSERLEKVCTIRGVSFISALSIIAETNGFELFHSSAQLVSWAGYDVVENQSGSSLKGKTRISKKGNRYVRRTLYFPAITASRHEGAFQDLYQRVFERSAIKMKGLVAVQRKLLVMIYTLYKKNESYDPAYYARQEEKRSRQDTSPAYAG